MKQQENRAEPQEKQIRFIDSHYNLKFYIPDGGKIRITFRDGHTADRVCKYIDDYHLYVGNCCYHICEFAEKMELSGSKVEPVNQSEPSKNKTRNREKHPPWLKQAAASASAPVNAGTVLLSDNGDKRLCPREDAGNHSRP